MAEEADENGVKSPSVRTLPLLLRLRGGPDKARLHSGPLYETYLSTEEMAKLVKIERGKKGKRNA